MPVHRLAGGVLFGGLTPAFDKGGIGVHNVTGRLVAGV
jgi:hypothetical protein